MAEYLVLGQMREVSNSSLAKCFLPHHGVLKTNTPTRKLRVVFNGSARNRGGLSLNSLLHTGPNLLLTLFELILRWRFYKFVFTTDVEKMFRQIPVHPDDQTFQAILWRPAVSSPIKTYFLTTITYGLACSPFLATRVLRQLASEHAESHPRASRILREEFYVDDCLSGGHSVEEASIKCEELTKLARLGGFPLRKWSSNSPQALASVPLDHRVDQPKTLQENPEAISVLGLSWDPQTDEFAFKFMVDEFPNLWTKRTLFAQTARFFDPLGWFSLVIIVPKMLLQSLWLLKISWDTPLPDSVVEPWVRWLSEIPQLNQVRIPRWKFYSPSIRLEIYGFADASKSAYAAVVCTRVVVENVVHVSLQIAKTRVAPLKVLSIPQLELCGAHLLAKVVRHFTDSCPCDGVPIHLKTDSLNVLHWLNAPPSKWPVFVANRPAFHLSMSCLTTIELESASLLLIFDHQQRHFAHDIAVLKRNANLLISQQEHLPASSRLRKLAPFFSDGLLRVGGRLSNALLDSNAKHPLILFGRDSLTLLLVKRYHLLTLHGGTQITLTALRRKYWVLNGRQIVSSVLSHCLTCRRYAAQPQTQLMADLPAARVTPSPAFLRTGVDYASPFPVRLAKHRGRGTLKDYVAVFICMVTRAVHLEVVEDYTADSFIAAFLRFTSRRGQCSDLYSDRGTNFVGADREMSKMLMDRHKNVSFADALCTLGTQWHFNPPQPPHFGGLWEAAVKLTRFHLKRVIGNQ
ncbi:uncharacterized protein LOC106645815, partial [Copidosoma floridanum]|uniref:uncharacterized protein LOC106645815 n=1 Tax=Copidosoma floridanum TaxID=29053 RepID=UPI0006C99E49